jgi:hypothetical protein
VSSRQLTARGLAALALGAALSLAPAVTARADGPPAPPGAYEDGDLVWTVEPPDIVQLVRTVALDSCQRLPIVGFLATGAQASTSTRYSSSWSWSAASSQQPFSWWLFTGGGRLKDDGASGGGGGSTTVASNNHFLRIKNRGYTPQAWTVCSD